MTWIRDECDRLRAAFRHYHTKSAEDGDDSCAACGLDLRDPVHCRVGQLPAIFSPTPTCRLESNQQYVEDAEAALAGTPAPAQAACDRDPAERDLEAIRNPVRVVKTWLPAQAPCAECGGTGRVYPVDAVPTRSEPCPACKAGQR